MLLKLYGYDNVKWNFTRLENVSEVCRVWFHKVQSQMNNPWLVLALRQFITWWVDRIIQMDWNYGESRRTALTSDTPVFFMLLITNGNAMHLIKLSSYIAEVICQGTLIFCQTLRFCYQYNDIIIREWLHYTKLHRFLVKTVFIKICILYIIRYLHFGITCSLYNDKYSCINYELPWSWKYSNERKLILAGNHSCLNYCFIGQIEVFI